MNYNFNFNDSPLPLSNGKHLRVCILHYELHYELQKTMLRIWSHSQFENGRAYRSAHNIDRDGKEGRGD